MFGWMKKGGGSLVYLVVFENLVVFVNFDCFLCIGVNSEF